MLIESGCRGCRGRRRGFFASCLLSHLGRFELDCDVREVRVSDDSENSAENMCEICMFEGYPRAPSLLEERPRA